MSVAALTLSELTITETVAFADAEALGATELAAVMGIVYKAAAAELAEVTLMDTELVAPAAMLPDVGFVAVQPVGTAAVTLNDAAELSLLVTLTAYVTVAPALVDCVPVGASATVGATCVAVTATVALADAAKLGAEALVAVLGIV